MLSPAFLAEQGVAGRYMTLLLALAMGLSHTGAAMADPPGPDGSKSDNERLTPGLYPAAPVPEGFAPAEGNAPPFALDWSVGLKGSYTASNLGNSFVTTLNPKFTAVHDGRRTDLSIEGSADIARPWDGSGAVDLSSLRLGLTGTTALDSTTRFTGNAAINLSQQLASAPRLDSVVTAPPRVVTGSLGVGLDKSFGRFNLGLKGSAERTLYGTSTRSDTGATDNSDQNVWSTDASLRLGFQATPIFELFGQASVGRDMFDAASSGLGVRTDATSTALRAGISGQWGGVLSASASVGVGRNDFDAPGLVDIDTQLYDASLTFAPDPTLRLTASLATTVSPTGADARGTARVDHDASANLDYTVNTWLRLRAAANWGQAVLAGSGETEERRGLGAGADYKLNAHTALSADYGFSHRSNSTSGTLDAHTVSLGVTIKR